MSPCKHADPTTPYSVSINQAQEEVFMQYISITTDKVGSNLSRNINKNKYRHYITALYNLLHAAFPTHYFSNSLIDLPIYGTVLKVLLVDEIIQIGVFGAKKGIEMVCKKADFCLQVCIGFWNSTLLLSLFLQQISLDLMISNESLCMLFSPPVF